ncbi:MAG: hypothetical protein MH321_11860 [Leptospiraceae bacterium]|nr:hypothetical protein [Leptospiraceae bacterium]
MKQTLLYIVIVLSSNLGNCKFLQNKNPSESTNYENAYLKIQDSYLTFESKDAELFVVIDFLVHWKKNESVQLKILDLKSGNILFNKSLGALPFMKLRSNYIDLRNRNNSWLYENKDLDSQREIQFIIETSNKEGLVLNYNLLITKETKHSLIQKFTLQ